MWDSIRLTQQLIKLISVSISRAVRSHTPWDVLGGEVVSRDMEIRGGRGGGAFTEDEGTSGQIGQVFVARRNAIIL